MRYDKYECRYTNLNNDKHSVQQKVKHGVKVYVASRRVATCTIRKLRSKIINVRERYQHKYWFVIISEAILNNQSN